jgi:hypothetical protein
MLAEIDAAFCVAPVVPENVSIHVHLFDNSGNYGRGHGGGRIVRIRFTLTLFSASVVFRCDLPSAADNIDNVCSATIVSPKKLVEQTRVWIHRTFTPAFIAESMKHINESVSVCIRTESDESPGDANRRVLDIRTLNPLHVHAFIADRMNIIDYITFG